MNWSDIAAVQAMISNQGKPPDIEAVRQVDRHLKLCKNPEKVPGSRAFLAKKAEEEQKATEKRTKKAVESQKAMEEDPFGGSSNKPRMGLVDYDDDDDDEDDDDD
jgi:cyclin H